MEREARSGDDCKEQFCHYGIGEIDHFCLVHLVYPVLVMYQSEKQPESDQELSSPHSKLLTSIIKAIQRISGAEAHSARGKCVNGAIPCEVS